MRTGRLAYDDFPFTRTRYRSGATTTTPVAPVCRAVGLWPARVSALAVLSRQPGALDDEYPGDHPVVLPAWPDHCRPGCHTLGTSLRHELHVFCGDRGDRQYLHRDQSERSLLSRSAQLFYWHDGSLPAQPDVYLYA